MLRVLSLIAFALLVTAAIVLSQIERGSAEGERGSPEVERATPVTTDADLFVSSGGDDAASGTETDPFRSIDHALKAAGQGPAVVEVQGGTYPVLKDGRERSGLVTVRASRDTQPSIEGVVVYGGQRLAFDGFELGAVSIHGANEVSVSDSDISGPVAVQNIADTPSSTIRLASNVVSAAGKACVTVRGGARDVVVQDNHIHGCRVGISGAVNSPQSSGIAIRDNVIERLDADGIQFAGWDDVVIDGNVIRDMKPIDASHSDAIQFMGNSSGVRVTNNVLARSWFGQLVLIQDNFGPIDDVLVANNLMHDAYEGFAVQNAGATGVRFINNTIWRSRYGGLLLRQSKFSGTTPTDTVVVNNILSGYSEVEGARTARREANAVQQCSPSDTEDTAGLLCDMDPAFVNPEADDYELQADSPARNAGTPDGAPTHDLRDRLRGTPPALGALESP